MQSYHLTDEFTDISAEQALLASLAQSPALYWDLLDLLTPEVFAHETATWKTIALAFESDQPRIIPADWLPALAPPHNCPASCGPAPAASPPGATRAPGAAACRRSDEGCPGGGRHL